MVVLHMQHAQVGFSRVLKLFEKQYQEIPLEVFGNDPYKTLVSIILSARTRDETTYKICIQLFKQAPNFQELARIPVPELTRILHPVGFYKSKARYLSQTAKIIMDHHHGNVPDTQDQLIQLPGVGRKTANLILARAFDKQTISVDTHVHRIANLLGWVHTRTPEQTERQLVKIIPKRYWKDINRLFVSLGRQFRSKRKLQEFLEQNHLI